MSSAAAEDGAGLGAIGAGTEGVLSGAGTGCAADGSGAGCGAGGAESNLADPSKLRDADASVIQVIEPTVMVMLASNFMDAGKETIWIARGSRTPPPTWRATVDFR